MPDILATPRFTGRRIQPTDLPDFTRLHLDQRVMRTMSAEHDPASDEQLRHDFAGLLEQWERDGMGTWAWARAG